MRIRIRNTVGGSSLPVVPALHVQANKILALERCTEEGQALCPLPAPLHALGFQDPEQRANKVLTQMVKVTFQP
jgi:hypothetical protein